MKRLERLYALSERLRRSSPGTVSTRQLAAEFDVSRRTIERDLDALRRSGAALWGQPGRTGGVGILDGERRLISLSDNEIAGLVIAAHAADSAPFATEAKRAAEQLVARASSEAQVSIESVRECVLLSTEQGAKVPQVRHELEQGILHGRQVALRYRDRDGVVTNRRVDPVGFLGDGGIWSLIAFCRLRSGGRLFRVQRIERATLTKVSADRHDVREILGEVPFETRQPR